MRRAASLILASMLSLTACGGSAGGSVGPIVIPTISPTSTPAPGNSSADCPTSGSSPTSIFSNSSAQAVHRAAPSTAGESRYVPGVLAVTYAAGARTQSIDQTASRLHAVHSSDIDFGAVGLHTRVLSVNPAQTDAAMTQLRTLAGVRSVSRVSYRYRQSITANDPYYAGFTGTLPPYDEAAAIPGQWDMHAINVAGAWSQFTSSPVIGAQIAIVDTGADVTHPELVSMTGGPTPKIVRTECFVTYPSTATQTTGTYVTDTDGHGTNVTGIADGDTNNSFAFASVAFDAPLMIYRIFPTDPSSGCEGSNNPQCGTNTADEASAINDAVAHGAKVINLSLGADPPCDTADPEYVAVENAIASGTVVVAAAGNEHDGLGPQPFLSCPAADPGVIAVGASALNDTSPTDFEYVASYSYYLNNNGTGNGGAYLVAPGGDPCSGSSSSSCTDTDDLHWIEHISSSTAYSGGSQCNTDYASETGDCRVLIAGTSQATPHVTGVVALMLAKNPNLTPAQIATGLCATADNINDPKQGCGRVNASAAVNWAATH